MCNLPNAYSHINYNTIVMSKKNFPLIRSEGLSLNRSPPKTAPFSKRLVAQASPLYSQTPSYSQRPIPQTASFSQRPIPQTASFSQRPVPQTAAYSQRLATAEPVLNVFDEDSQENNINHEENPGTSAKLGFYSDYKNIIRLSEKSRMNKGVCTPNVAYLSEVYSNKLKPKSFGLAGKAGTQSTIDLRMLSMGDSYAGAFSQGIKFYPQLQTLNLRANRLTDCGSEKILGTIDMKQLKKLNLSENALGNRAIKKITDILSLGTSKLKHLNIEKTNVGDRVIIEICAELNYNKRLTKLILAKNNLSDKCAKCLKEMLVSNNSLKVLDLHWNVFHSEGAASIFEGLVKNTTLLVLDFSWNSLGKNEVFTEKISTALRLNTTLSHLDLSYNSFTEKECKIIGENLKHNHSLFGIHITGSPCTIDTRGFVYVCSTLDMKKGLFYKRIIEKKPYMHEISSNCWVCEKWIEQTFSCASQGSFVFIHFEFEEYRPELMLSVGNNMYEITRVVPSRSVDFFFSELNNAEVSCRYLQVPKHIEVSIGYYEEMLVTLVRDFVYLMRPDGEVCNIKSPFFTKPRVPGLKLLPPTDKLERIIWNIRRSIFKDYSFDTARLLDDCLEFDWKYSRLSNFVRAAEDQASLKAVLRKYYALIKNAYKILSAYSGNDLFSVGSNIMTDFLNQCKLFDNLYGANDFGVNLNSTLVQKEKGQLYNPGNSLVRYEFLEILVRIAMDRFIRNKICPDYETAVAKLLDVHILPVISMYSIEKWRNEEYLCEEVELVLRANIELLKALFKKYSGKYTLPGKKPFMSLEEFRTLCIDAGLVGDNFATREIDVCFSQAMSTQVDELFLKRHMEMNITEMFEALCRALDASGSYSGNPSKMNSIIQSKLSRKIEAAMAWLLKLCPTNFQDSYNFPSKEVYTRMMYTIKIQR